MLETELLKLFKPYVDGVEDWGQCDEETKQEFVQGVERFITELQDNLRNVIRGLELKKPDRRFMEEVANKARIQDNSEMIDHFENLLEEWCSQTESALEDRDNHDKSHDSGPLSELEYWRRRMQKLTNINDQIKTRECKTVIASLSSLTKSPQDQSRQKIFNLLRRWKQLDISITEAANEAKDNVKYLFTLDRFIEPLYTGTPQSIMETLPALMNSIRMLHSIARYYNTNERMTGLFVKITNQMIANCKFYINGNENSERMWQQAQTSEGADELVHRLEDCLKLNEAYQEQYRITKDKLLTNPKGKQFDFNDGQLFGKFDLFCRRVIKLIDMFSTIHQFTSLGHHNLEGIDELLSRFNRVITDFRNKRHDLLDYHNNKFDRDYVEFNVKIGELEAELQQFINNTFDQITSIEKSLHLLQKFQSILQRETLKNDLDSKFTSIFAKYGAELQEVQELYEKHKHSPPIPRNLPPVAGNITWSRHLLKRIEEPMKRFEANQNVLHSKDSRKIIKTYNKVARTLVAFEYLWYQAWIQSIESAKTGLQATLIIRHPEDGKLYVNFDPEILQLIREAKCLDRMGIEIPESAKIVLLQEEKFKSYNNELVYALKEYDRIMCRIIPVTSALLKPHLNDMEYKLRPGMITLTWTSMNIDAYRHHVHSGLVKLEELVTNINDIIENRIEKNLKTISKTLLVDLPSDQSFTLEEFVSMQERFVTSKSVMLQGKNIEVENAVEDLVHIITSFLLDPHIESVSMDDIAKLRQHYNHFMYQALLNCIKNSLNAMKKRVGSRTGTGFLFMQRPFFEVDVQLSVPSVRLSPSLDDIQKALNKSALAVLRCSKFLWNWGQQHIEDDGSKTSFYELITKDMEIVRVVLLLTGSVQGVRNQVNEYLQTFHNYDWLWRDDKDVAYKRFMQHRPALEDYEEELKKFVRIEQEIEDIAPINNIGPLSLNTSNLKLQLKQESSQWKIKYSDNLHQQSRQQMEALIEYMKQTTTKLNREIDSLDVLRFVMGTLREIRERESGIDMEINPVLDMYTMLETYLPAGYMDKEEMDMKAVLRNNWKKLTLHAEQIADQLTKLQVGFKRNLLRDIKDFVVDVRQFRADFVANGPMVPGLAPMEAVERLNRFKQEFQIRERKYELYRSGEELFGLPTTDHPDLMKSKKDLQLLEQLYGLYVEVIETIEDYKSIPWLEVSSNISTMSDKVEQFDARCRKLPGRLREWDAYKDLKKQVEGFMTVLPLLQALSKESIRPWHWQEVMKVTETKLNIGDEDFTLQGLLDAHLENFKDEIEEIAESADKQAAIAEKLTEIKDKWATEEFQFTTWKNQPAPILKAVSPIIEDLEEAQMQLQTILTMKHVTPFKEEVQNKLTQLSDTSETLERWLKVQMLWCSLESVFTSGDIAKQMPIESKKFQKINKDWLKIMLKSQETGNVVSSCGNELLKNTLPVLYSELEKCQKSLEGYLEQKRGKFPRFYFVSDFVLLQVLSQGSDPMAIQDYYEKVFDAISRVDHNAHDVTKIEAMQSVSGSDIEKIPFHRPVKAQGGIEDWLMELLCEMQRTMKDISRNCAQDCDSMELRQFVDSYPGQFALLGIQLLWTAEVQEALQQCRVKKNIMADTNKHIYNILMELSSWCLQDLGTKMNRTKIETLVTIHLHQRDVTNDLTNLFKQRKISDPNDFEWLKQARFYWRPDDRDMVDDSGALVISVTDVDFKYSYEYLGCKERLVITPLTDRCYITLAQAMGMYFGGAPAGPAGTGKTETVKDLGRALGIFVVVTNCTDQMRYSDCAKIFKGLCQAGLWGCFDEFNRITLPVLSVVAQQVLAINNAKKSGLDRFSFPGDPPNESVILNSACGYFITMNPGYAGRQELPENLKALFRGVAMMVPDREVIMKVKLCSVGYTEFVGLAKKFNILYKLCEQQLSKQKHYDFGLRNILSVLRTAGKTKRDNLDKPEDLLLMRTLRDMNLSKMVAQDIPLFLSLLKDLFPGISPPAKTQYGDLETSLRSAVEGAKLIYHDNWVTKVIQLYETTLVRHGIMLVGPAGGGKTRIFEMLQAALSETTQVPHKQARLNPKAIRAAEMYGEVDKMSGEWTTGVFAAMWAKYNNRTNKNVTWIICDGPVDAIWIEDLNTVLDDNRILTLANGDRIPMTDNTKIMFEVENLSNASPATVSRAGIIFVSDIDLDWPPVVQSWLNAQDENRREILKDLIFKWVGAITETEQGHIFTFLRTNTEQVMSIARVGLCASLCNLLNGVMASATLTENNPEELRSELERLFLYSLCWTIGGLLEPEDRIKFDTYLRSIDDSNMPQDLIEGESIFEYYVDEESLIWQHWRAPAWTYPTGDRLNFSNLLVPTMDSTRSMYIIENLHKQRKNVLLVGGPGTAKTTCALMFLQTLNSDVMMSKRINFSSATTPGMFQSNIEAEIEKRGGRKFGPPQNKKMTVFLDDLSMPQVNLWGDQPALEIVRQLLEEIGFRFLDKDKRGDWKEVEDLQYIAAMNHPGGGKNDIPNRLKRQFLVFNLIMPSNTSIDDIFGQMLRGRFTSKEFNQTFRDVVDKLTGASIRLWGEVKKKMLPTPAKFHYIFNMRELSRVFQGVLLTPKITITEGGVPTSAFKFTPKADGGNVMPTRYSPPGTLLSLWKHECERVFCDKLATDTDKQWYEQCIDSIIEREFGSELASEVNRQDIYYMDFYREDEYDDDEVLVAPAEKLYELGGSLPLIRERVYHFLNMHNTDFPQKQMNLVLFDNALQHLMRINRIIQQARGSALLVGVGGSGKQSLTRLAAYISKHYTFQITLTKSYGINAFLDDIRELYKVAGHQLRPVTFVFTDAEIKDENFLEYINGILMTGEIAGLIPKDEMGVICNELRDAFAKNRPGVEDTMVNLQQFFIDNVRDNLHIVLCMSPVNPKFPERARKFPGLINGCTIDWFLPWPEEALVSVARGFITDFAMDTDQPTKDNLTVHMGMVHKLTVDVCTEYFHSMRRHVYQTPKSFLSFLQNYKKLYSHKLSEIRVKESRVTLGLEKLLKGAEDVEAMKIVLADEQVKLQKATEETNVMLGNLEIQSLEAKKESDSVAQIKASCEEEAAKIQVERDACESDLAAARPFLEQAEQAANSIKPPDIQEIKKLPKPSDIIKLVFDGVLLLFMGELKPIQTTRLNVNKKDLDFVEPSYDEAQRMMDPKFLNSLLNFPRDNINEETIELLNPYLDLEDFQPQVARNASKAAAGLCSWVKAMRSYHEASKVVKPKLEALAAAEVRLEAAQEALFEAEARLKACKDVLDKLQADFEKQMAEKNKIEENAAATKKKMEQAQSLINGLAGERQRWTEDAASFADTKRRLVGDCAVACAFVSYCGPFNQEFRTYIISDRYTKDLELRSVPVTRGLNVTHFLVDIGTIGDWNMQGLPTDPLSIQNGILVTRSSRYPLLIDPQGQALNWIREKEKENLPMFGVTQLSFPRLKDQLEFCMSEGRALIITGVEQEIDPMFDPVLEKEIVVKGKSKYINVADKNCEYNDDFMLYFVTRLPNPHFSPELSAKTTIIDFAVTMKGLEEQLLGRVISKEQKALEEQLSQVLAEVTSNTKSLLQLDALLLERLTSNSGNLLDDVELIGVLANTKAKAAEVKEKLTSADETKLSINEKREQYRPVATRGSVLYFSIVEMSSVNPMYQTSLKQFLELFERSMDVADKANLASKRVSNIIDSMTYIVYRYINRGLYEKDKLTFVLLVTLKILVTEKLLTGNDVTLFLRGGAALNANTVRKCPFAWFPKMAWLNVVQLSQSSSFFKTLPDEISRNEAMWRRWIDDNEPENLPIPDYDSRIAENREVGPFYKLLLVRSLREDRTLLATREFIRRTDQMGDKYVEPVTDTIDSIFDEMVAITPVIYLLSIGADPTEAIETLARKKKQHVVPISMGEGQEPIALKAINTAAISGTWVLLQNCELGLEFMAGMEELLSKLHESLNPDFRLFITALPHPQFPLGLLQMSTKVTNEPPSGLRAGLLRSYTVMVDQDRLERVDAPNWRPLLYDLCFLHSIVQERRKFGPLGWCIPYEYNSGDLSACILFLEKHLYSGPISWPTVQYMVSEVQYGGKITDDMDRRLFNTYASAWLRPEVLSSDFSYNPAHPINRIPNDFRYTIPDYVEIDDYRKMVAHFPEIDSPEMFGLHPNADLTFRTKEAKIMLNTLGETQPKSGGSGGGQSREEEVYQIADGLLGRMPPDYIEDDYKAKIQALGGLEVPLNIFLYQEIQRMQQVIFKVRFMLTSMQQAIRGEIVMTPEFLEALNAIFEAKVPPSWLYTPGGDEFSWLLPMLGAWFDSLTLRERQYSAWLTSGRPNCFWMTGFFNPQGFLTAMQQEVTRSHKAEKWALDDVVYHTEVMEAEQPHQVRNPSEGVYIHGLSLDGCSWTTRPEKTLVESEPKKPFTALPILWVTAVTKQQKKTLNSQYGPYGPYECPCYKYAARGDRYLIFMAHLNTKDKRPSHWTLRGVALLCSTD